MIRVTLKPLWSDITFDDQDELDWLIVQGSVKSQFNPMTGSYGQIEYLFTDLRDGRPTSYPSADLDIPKAILTGAVPLVVAEAKDHGLQVIVDDAKWRVFAPKYVPTYDQLPVTLHPHQVAACDVAGQKKFGVIKAPTGCHRKGQLILMADGSTKKVEDVVVGDLLQGMDSPRRVLALARGRDTMAKIQPVKGESWDVNLDHILTLQHTQTGEMQDVAVRDWLTWSKTQKHLWKLFRYPVLRFESAPSAPLPVDPYFLGVLLGDGCLVGSISVCKPDQEIHDCCRQQAEVWGLRYVDSKPADRARFCTLVGPERFAHNPLISVLKGLGVWGATAGNKFVPQMYLSSSWEDRRQLLAGLLDTDGHMTRAGFDWISKSYALATAVEFLARSLGLAAYVKATYKECQTGAGGIYWRISLSGDCDLIPTRISRKQSPPRQQIKDVRRTGFSVTLLPPDDYYGFHLDGDQRYLLGDFTVTHNSGKTYCGIAISLGLHGTNVLVLVPGPGLLKAYVKGFAESGEAAGQLGDETRLVVTTYDRVASWLKKQPGPAQAYLARFRAVLADECHVCVSEGRLPVMRALINAQVRIGLSATPFDRSDKRDPLVAGVLGPRIYAIDTDELVERGHIAKADITMVAFAHEVSGSVEAMLRMKWATRYARHVVRNKERNRALLSLVERAAKPALLFVKELEHVYELERIIGGARLNVRSVTGAMGVRQREGLIDDIRRGRVDVVVCTKVWSTGIDIPELASVIVGGAGKCLAPDVRLRMADGTVKEAGEIRKGDQLAGPDGSPRTVLTTTAGEDEMYEVCPRDRGQAFRCTQDHILTVWNSRLQCIRDYSLQELAKQKNSHLLLTTRPWYYPPADPLTIPPYFMGLWVGDGRKDLSTVQVSKPDKEVRDACEEVAKLFGVNFHIKKGKEGKCPTYALTLPRGGNAKNPLLEDLRSYVGNAQQLPVAYLRASYEDRMEFLAGILDSDGYLSHKGYEIVQVRASYARDIKELAESLGFRVVATDKTVKAKVYRRLYIHGDTHLIPTRILRKQAAPRRYPWKGTTFTLKPVGRGRYAGFQVDNDGRYLLADGTITHNSSIDVVQTIGRGMRIADGKNTFEVWDLHDTVYTALHKQGQGRVRVYRGEGHQVNLLGDFDHKRGNDERDKYDAGADGDDGADDAA